MAITLIKEPDKTKSLTSKFQLLRAKIREMLIQIVIEQLNTNTLDITVDEFASKSPLAYANNIAMALRADKEFTNITLNRELKVSAIKSSDKKVTHINFILMELPHAEAI